MKFKGKIFHHIIISAFVLYGVFSFAQGEVSNNIQNEIEKKTFNYADTLQLDFYSTSTIRDSLRPLLVIVHGGGFSGGQRDNPQEVEFATKMATKGYAVASISYRLTRKGKTFGCDCPAEAKMKTFIAAAEDISKAVIFLHQKGSLLKFDINQTVLVGSSAGAEGILNTVFMQDHYLFKHIPSFPVAGIISLAGAVVDKDYITEDNVVPMLFFHGMKDNLVPYNTAPHHYCDRKAKGYLMLDGANAMVKRLEELHTPYMLAFDPNGNHDWSWLAYHQISLMNTFLEQIIKTKEFLQYKIQIHKP